MLLSILLGIVILILVVVLGYVIKALRIQIKKNAIHEQWIVELQNKVENVYSSITILDEKQMFNKDDEVGGIFTQIVDIIKSLNEITTKE